MGVFLQAFRDDAQLHGWAITKATTRSGSTVYGVLGRLENTVGITGRVKTSTPSRNRPRRLYRLTPTDIIAARDLLAAHRRATSGKWKSIMRNYPRLAILEKRAANRCCSRSGIFQIRAKSGSASVRCCASSMILFRYSRCGQRSRHNSR